MGDPGLLLAAEPTRLLRVLPTVISSAARAYQQAVHQLTSNRPLEERASCLHRAARYCEAAELAARIEGLGIALPWTTQWAHWQASGISRQLTGHAGVVRAVALGEIDGNPVIVSGGKDRNVRVWDPLSGLSKGRPRTGHAGVVQAVALGIVDGQPVIVSGGRDRTVRLWDARSGQPRGEPLVGHTGEVRAVALGEIDGQPVIVSSGDTTVRLWDARSSSPRGEPLVGHTGQVGAVALGVVDGQPVVVSSGGDRTVRVWDARSDNHYRIETDAESHGVACTPDGLIVAATSLGLAAFRLSTAASTAAPPSQTEVRL